MDYWNGKIKEAHKAKNGEKKKLAEKKFEKLKDDVFKISRLNWRGGHLEWLNTAVVLDSTGAPAYPSLLGSGGNDGNLDFTNNFMQRLADLFDLNDQNSEPRLATIELLENSLFESPTHNTTRDPIGQFAPGAAGGVNSSNSLSLDDGKSVNPWDYILMLEGAILFSASSSRRMSSSRVSMPSAPFTFNAESAGHQSSSVDEDGVRGEQWVPLWDNLSGIQEVELLLSEGKVQIGRKTARQPVDIARAIARLGVSRGIYAFERYAYLERNGQANLAVPLGRWKVVSQPKVELLGDIDGWLSRLQQIARGDKGSNALKMLSRRMTNTVMAVTQESGSPKRWQDILLAMVEVENAIVRGQHKDLRIVSNLNSGWLEAADDGSPEFRLALALAAQFGVRRHWLPLDKGGRNLAKLDDGQFAKSPSVVCFGRDLVSDCIALVNRRIVEAGQKGERLIDLWPMNPFFAARQGDLNLFLAGVLSQEKILGLAQAFMMLDPRQLRDTSWRPAFVNTGDNSVDDVYAMMRLCIMTEYLNDGLEHAIPMNPLVFSRLASNDVRSAARLAARHLRAHGLIPPVTLAIGDSRLLAASMAFSISSVSMDKLVKTMVPPANLEGERQWI
jgi:CRISPR-associated protein Csx17